MAYEAAPPASAGTLWEIVVLAVTPQASADGEQALRLRVGLAGLSLEGRF